MRNPPIPKSFCDSNCLFHWWPLFKLYILLCNSNLLLTIVLWKCMLIFFCQLLYFLLIRYCYLKAVYWLHSDSDVKSKHYRSLQESIQSSSVCLDNAYQILLYIKQSDSRQCIYFCNSPSIYHCVQTYLKFTFHDRYSQISHVWICSYVLILCLCVDVLFYECS